MKVGTRSLLFGYHQFVIHPLVVAYCWWKLYGFPWDPRLWVCFLVHDWGYWGCANMDGPEGERHVHRGAGIVGGLFDTETFAYGKRFRWLARLCNRLFGDRHGLRRIDPDSQYPGAPTAFWCAPPENPWHASWYCFSFYHSRFICRHYGVVPSRLCWADKQAIVSAPTWLQIALMRLAGELDEYKNNGDRGRTPGAGLTDRQFVEAMKTKCAGDVRTGLELAREAAAKKKSVDRATRVC